MRARLSRFMALVLVTALALTASAGLVEADGGGVTVTILHNNDGESRLLNAGDGLEDYGGAARFKTLVEIERARGNAGKDRIAVLLSSGDNFLAGPQFQASLDKGVPFYDSIVVQSLNYDAMAIGNHEFDFGPDVLADFICGFIASGGAPSFPECGRTGRATFPMVSANLDFSGEPVLQEFVDGGAIVKSLVIVRDGHKIGVVGATTPLLPFISSPRDVKVSTKVAQAIQGQVDALAAGGVNKIIVISHLQDVNEDLELATHLKGVDVMIAGGGDELLAKPASLLVPGDVYNPSLTYPLWATGADGTKIPVVTTAGDYKYLGKLVVHFDDDGKLISVDTSSGPIRVAGPGIEGGVNPDRILASAIEGPLMAYLEELESTVIATSEVGLDGRRDPGVRTEETNLGNLMADAWLWQANELATEYGVAPADIAIQNGGGIRNNNVIGPGEITLLNTFEIAPFSNFISIVEDISPAELKRLMENSVARVEAADGRFAQIAGFTLVWDTDGPPMEFDAEGNVVSEGSRVVSIQLDDGTYIVQNGSVLAGAPSVNMATIDFTARGGDQYPFESDFVPLGVSYQQALENYIVDGLGGVISAADYPEGGEGRIVAQ